MLTPEIASLLSATYDRAIMSSLEESLRDLARRSVDLVGHHVDGGSVAEIFVGRCHQMTALVWLAPDLRAILAPHSVPVRELASTSAGARCQE